MENLGVHPKGGRQELMLGQSTSVQHATRLARWRLGSGNELVVEWRGTGEVLLINRCQWHTSSYLQPMSHYGRRRDQHGPHQAGAGESGKRMDRDGLHGADLRPVWPRP